MLQQSPCGILSLVPHAHRPHPQVDPPLPPSLRPSARTLIRYSVRICLIQSGDKCSASFDYVTLVNLTAAPPSAPPTFYVGPASGVGAGEAVQSLLQPLDPGSDYRLRAAARNAIGLGSYSPWLAVHTVHRPDQIEWLANPFISIGATHIAVAWKKPEDHGSPLEGYYLAVDGNTASPIFIDSGSSAATQYYAAGLAFYSLHSFQVRAKNKYGFGEWSFVVQATTDGSLPTIESVALAGRQLQEMSWSWSAAFGNGFNVSHYQVFVCAGSRGTCPLRTGQCLRTLASVATSAVLPVDTTSFTATGLEPFTGYRLGVRANSTGYPDFDSCDGEECPLTISQCYLTRDFPSAPQNLRLTADNGGLDDVTYLWPEWDAANGFGLDIKRYELAITVANATATEYRLTGGTQLLLSGLEPGTSLHLAVRAESSVGWGSWSANTSFATALARPPARPLAPIRAPLLPGSSDVTSLAVQWSAPASIGVPVLRYELYSKTEAQNGTWTTRSVYVGPLQFYQADELVNGSSLTFFVVALNQAGRSLPSLTVTLSTVQGEVPSQPGSPLPVRPSAAYSAATSVRIKISPTDGNGLPITSYRAEIDGPAFDNVRRTITPSDPLVVLPSSSCTINNNPLPCLRPNSTYSIIIVANNAEGSSLPSEPLVITTAIGTPPAKPVLLLGSLPLPNRITYGSIRWRPPVSLYPISAYTLRLYIGAAEASINPQAVYSRDLSPETCVLPDVDHLSSTPYHGPLCSPLQPSTSAHTHAHAHTHTSSIYRSPLYIAMCALCMLTARPYGG